MTGARGADGERKEGAWRRGAPLLVREREMSRE